MVIGWTALLVGALGLLHIANGTPTPSDGAASIRAAGGLIGYLASAPLVAAVTPWVAAPLLALVSGFGVLVITGTPLHRVPSRLAELRDFGTGAGQAVPETEQQPGPPGRTRRKRPEAIEAGEHIKPYDTPILLGGTAGRPPGSRPGAGATSPGAGAAGTRGPGGEIGAGTGSAGPAADEDDSLLDILDGTIIGIDYPRHRRVAILKAHEEIYAALARRDPQASLDRMREHIEAYATYAQRKFPEILDQIISWDRQPG